MKKSIAINVLLIISGIIGIIVGAGLLLSPIEFQSSSGISLPNDVDILSEARASGGLLLTGGMAIFLGAFISKLRLLSIVLSCLFYFSYGISRVLSMLLDGLPNQSVLIITVLEVALGIISLLVLLNTLKNIKSTNAVS